MLILTRGASRRGLCHAAGNNVAHLPKTGHTHLFNLFDPKRSTIGLLVTGAGTVTSEFLGLLTSGISNKETFIVLDEEFLELSLGGLIVVLLVVGDDGLADSETDSHDLGGGTTTTHADADVEVLEELATEEEDGFEGLKLQGLGLNKLDGLGVNLDIAVTFGAVINSGGILLSAEALNLLGLRHLCSLS